jgi:hypothetical protein
MGNSTSTLDTDGPSPPSKALHILRVSPGSPAAQTDIDPFFDFVVGIDNDELASVSTTVIWSAASLNLLERMWMLPPWGNW